MPNASNSWQGAPRYEATAYVDYAGRAHQASHRLQNISLGGICLHVPQIEMPGKRVHLRITFPELACEFVAEGEVVWSRADTRDMGIRFLDMDEERAAVLQRYLDAVGRKRPPTEPPELCAGRAFAQKSK